MLLLVPSANAAIDAMTARRHRIVHQADTDDSRGASMQINAWPSTSFWDLPCWAWTLELFSLLILEGIAPAGKREKISKQLGESQKNMKIAEAKVAELIVQYRKEGKPSNDFTRMLGLSTNRRGPKKHSDSMQDQEILGIKTNKG
jgi:hypothetical protein